MMSAVAPTNGKLYAFALFSDVYYSRKPEFLLGQSDFLLQEINVWLFASFALIAHLPP